MDFFRNLKIILDKLGKICYNVIVHCTITFKKWIKMKLIKRYKNRILYDTVTKSFITLADIARFIRDKVDFRVVESETGEDITGTTIMQVLLNIEKRAKKLGNVVKSIRHSAGKKTEKLLHTLMEHIGSMLDLMDRNTTSK